MSIAIHALSERVKIFARKTNPDDRGGWSEKWVPGKSYWAAVNPLNSNKQTLGMGKGVRLGGLNPASFEYHVIFRAGAEVPSDARILWRSKIFSIVGEPTLSIDKETLHMTISRLKENETVRERDNV